MQEWLLKTLKAIVYDGQYSNLYLNAHIKELPEPNRALARSIVYGLLSHFAFCQAIWKQYVAKKPNRTVSLILSLGVYELFFVDKMPDYAVIDECVSLAKKVAKDRAGFVNAVLRKAASRQVPHFSDPLEKAAFEHSLPDWLLKMWKAQYGEETALDLAAASDSVHPVFVRVNPLKSSQKALLETGRFVQDDKDRLIYAGNGLESDQDYIEGHFSIQDPGSYAIAKLADPKPGDLVLDVCAAPGTKTMAMAELMDNKGHIDALDLHEHRVKLIEQDAKRLGIDIVSAKAADSSKLEADPVYDVVLCDVPCSGYGVLARKPDMKLKLDPSTMDTLIPLQAEIFDSAAGMVKEGGRLIYSTCTLNKKENEKQVEAFLKRHPDFECRDMNTILMNTESDGFFMAALEKMSGKE